MKAIYLFLGFFICIFFFSCKKKSIHDAPVNDNAQLKKGLIAYYPFNGNANDESGNGNNLIIAGAVLTNNRFGELQKAYKFNGVSDYMTIPKILKADSLRELSISVWVKVATLSHSSVLSFISGGPDICSSYVGFDNRDNDFSTSHQMVTLSTPSNCTTTIIKNKIDNPLDTWNHIVLIQQHDVNNTAIRYRYTSFYNGKKLKTETTPFDINTTPASFSGGGIIGGNNNTGNYSVNFDYFQGSIDDVRIYSRALTDDEVARLYLLKE